MITIHYLTGQEVLETEQEEERLVTRSTVARLQQALARAGQQEFHTLAIATLSWAATNTLLHLLLLLGACCRIR